MLLSSEKIVSVGQDAVVFSLDKKVKISSFKPKAKFLNNVESLKVSILNEKTQSTEFAIIGDGNTVVKENLYIPKKIMQNPNFLIGRTVSDFIKTEKGEVIINRGERITEKTIAKAKIHNKIYELSCCANWNICFY